MSTERRTQGHDPEHSGGTADATGAPGTAGDHPGDGTRTDRQSLPEPAEQHDRPDDVPGVVDVTGTRDGDGTAAPTRRSRLAVGAVAAAVLLAGGGGAYLAVSSQQATRDAASSATGGTPPLLSLDDYTPPAASSDGSGTTPGGSGRAGIAPGEPDPNGAGGTSYRAVRPLPKGPSSASVYRTAGTVTADRVARLAKALHVSGTPKPVGAGWQVGRAGTAPELQVTRQAPGSWTFTRATAGNCGGSTTCPTADGTGKPVGEAAAKAAAAPVLKALGQDGAKVDAGQQVGSMRMVSAAPTVGGLPSYDWSTEVRVGTDGAVAAGSGKLLGPEKGAAYPVLSASRTLELLNAAQTSHTMHPGACTGTQQRAGAPCAGGGQGGATVPARGTTVPVTGAVFGLATHYQNGRPVLVPSWLFQVKPQASPDSYTLTYPAVDPRYLRNDNNSSGGTDPGAPSTPGATGKVHLTSYTAEDSKLEVQFYGGVCNAYTASAKETTDRVTVTVTEHKPAQHKVCPLIARKLTRTVTLKKPLGNRKVVDATGATVRHR